MQPTGKQSRQIKIRVRVQPRASRRQIGPVKDGRLRVRTPAAPTNGKANQDVARQLAAAFGVPPSRVRLLRGATSRQKTYRVDSPQILPDWAQDLDFS